MVTGSKSQNSPGVPPDDLTLAEIFGRYASLFNVTGDTSQIEQQLANEINIPIDIVRRALNGEWGEVPPNIQHDIEQRVEWEMYESSVNTEQRVNTVRISAAVFPHAALTSWTTDERVPAMGIVYSNGGPDETYGTFKREGQGLSAQRIADEAGIPARNIRAIVLYYREPQE